MLSSMIFDLKLRQILNMSNIKEQLLKLISEQEELPNLIEIIGVTKDGTLKVNKNMRYKKIIFNNDKQYRINDQTKADMKHHRYQNYSTDNSYSMLIEYKQEWFETIGEYKITHIYKTKEY